MYLLGFFVGSLLGALGFLMARCLPAYGQIREFPHFYTMFLHKFYVETMVKPDFFLINSPPPTSPDQQIFIAGILSISNSKSLTKRDYSPISVTLLFIKNFTPFIKKLHINETKKKECDQMATKTSINYLQL